MHSTKSQKSSKQTKLNISKPDRSRTSFQNFFKINPSKTGWNTRYQNRNESNELTLTFVTNSRFFDVIWLKLSRLMRNSEMKFILTWTIATPANSKNIANHWVFIKVFFNIKTENNAVVKIFIWYETRVKILLEESPPRLICGWKINGIIVYNLEDLPWNVAAGKLDTAI